MKRIAIIISTLAALLLLGSCTKETQNGGDPVPDNKNGDLVATLQGIPQQKTAGRTLAAFADGGQTDEELLIDQDDNVYLYLFRNDATGTAGTDADWHLVYTVRAKGDLETLPAPQATGNSSVFSATFPLFNEGEYAGGKVAAGPGYKAVYVVNQASLLSSVSFAPFTDESSASLTIDKTSSTSLETFKKLASAPALLGAGTLRSPFVMFGETDAVFTIYRDRPSTAEKVVLTRVAARIDITNLIGDQVVQLLSAQVMQSSDRGTLSDVAVGTGAGDAYRTVAPAGQTWVDQKQIDNSGFDLTLGLRGDQSDFESGITPNPDKNYMWGHLYTYPTNNGLLEELQASDPDRADIVSKESTGDTTRTFVRIRYNIWKEGNPTLHSKDVYFRNGVDTVYKDPVLKTDVLWYPNDPVRINRNTRYEIVIQPQKDSDLPAFTVIAQPWTDSIHIDTTDLARVMHVWLADTMKTILSASGVDLDATPTGARGSLYFGGGVSAADINENDHRFLLSNEGTQSTTPGIPGVLGYGTTDVYFFKYEGTTPPDISYRHSGSMLKSDADGVKDEYGRTLLTATYTPDPGTPGTLAVSATGSYKGIVRVYTLPWPGKGTGQVILKDVEAPSILAFEWDGPAKMMKSANSFIVDGKISAQPIAFPGNRANVDSARQMEFGSGSMLIPVTTQRLPNTTEAVRADVLWKDVSGGVVASVKAYGRGKDAIVMVTPDNGNTTAYGNAVVTLRNAANTVVWSWHIWNTDYNPNVNLDGMADLPSSAGIDELSEANRNTNAELDGAYQVTGGHVWRYTGTGRSTQTTDLVNRNPVTTYGSLANDAYGIYNATNVFMDRNLGAMNATPGDAGSKGLLYQWGRKDPFPGSVGWTTTEPTIYGPSSEQRTVRENAAFTSYSAMADGYAIGGAWGVGKLAVATAAGTYSTAISGAPAGIAPNTANVHTNNTLNFAVAYPLVFIYGFNNSATGYDWFTAVNSRNNQADGLWGWSTTSHMDYDKSVYDPCPEGWRVPKNGAWQGLDDDDSASSVVEREYAFPWRGDPWFGRFGMGTGAPDLYSGWIGNYWANYTSANTFLSSAVPWADPVLALNDGSGRWSTKATVGYFPAAGNLGAGEGARWNVSTYGFVWSSSRYPVAYPQYASYLYFLAADVIPTSTANRGYGFTVRCVQEE